MAFSNINVVIDDLPDFSAVDYQLLAPEFAKIRAAVAGAFLCLALVAWAVGHRDVSPAMAEQAALRLAGFLGHDDEPWTLI